MTPKFHTIYLMRHGIAEAPERCRSDFERSLTERGSAQVRALAIEFLKHAAPQPLQIFSSPLKRAFETATLMAEPSKVLVIALNALSCGTVNKSLFSVKELHDLNSDQAVMLVGHDPDLSFIAGYLLVSSAAPVIFGRAGIACLQAAQGDAQAPWQKHAYQLAWYKTPEMLGV